MEVVGGSDIEEWLIAGICGNPQAGRQRQREHIALERRRLPGGDSVNQVALEHVSAGVEPRQPHSICRFFLKSTQVSPGWVQQDCAESGSIVQPGDGNGRNDRTIGSFLFMVHQYFLVVGRQVGVTVEYERTRLEIPFGVSYASDPHAVHEIALASIKGVNRILPDPEPSCHFIKFGDFSLDFVLRFWISDPSKGISRVRSDVMYALWDAFKREGIEIPFPVREVRITEGSRPPSARLDSKLA